MAKGFSNLVYDSLMLEVSCCTDKDTLRRIAFFEKLIDLVSGKGLNQFHGSTYRRSQRVLAPTDPVEKVVDIVVRGILHHPNFLKNDHSLLFHIVWFHDGMEENIGQEVNSKGEILINHRGVNKSI